jgi:Transcriptional regulators, similar to M. xanthus CarD
MYPVGSLIIYGGTGVCRVTEISSRKADGALCYELQPLYQSCTIFTPVDNGKVFMRPVISQEEAESLIDRIPTVHPQAFHSRVQREVVEHYDAAMKSHTCGDLLKLTMSIYAKKKNSKAGAVDERYMKRAEDLLFGELAAALQIPRDDVPHYIARRVGTLDKAN